MNGFFVIDKPAGITSHDVVSRVRRIVGSRHVGHTGTLDPFATGVLPIAVNAGTKAIPFLDEGIKCYEALMRLGVKTDTLDMTGRVIAESDYSKIDRNFLDSVLPCFTGEISQTPPMFSAIKQNGEPLYKLARKGIEVERKSRQVNIYSIEVLVCEPPLVRFFVQCSRGTYIRSLADDIGSALGCGATLQGLRRTASGLFDTASAVTLDELEKKSKLEQLTDLLITPYDALAHLGDIVLNENGLAKLKHGRAPELADTLLAKPLLSTEAVLTRLSFGGSLVAVAELAASCGESFEITLKRVFC